MKGYYITEGVKYGCDFLLYEADPEHSHAKYMVFILDCSKPKFNQLVMYERMAGSNKKIAVLCWMKEDGLHFIIASQYQIHK